MRLARFFIDRPIFATVLSLLILLFGALSYRGLPVSQFPDVSAPSIVIRASYPGANAAVVAETVAGPLEQEINGVHGMIYMSSESTNQGQMTLTVTFATGTNLNVAQILVQNRIASAESRLPEEVRRLGIKTEITSPDLLLIVHLVSPTGEYDFLYMSNYALLHVKDVLARIDGVGSTLLVGPREYSMRIWLDPERVAARMMTTGDVLAALREQNVQVAAGILGQPPAPTGIAEQLTVTARGRLTTPEEFADIILKTGSGGSITRLRDVARIELGARDYGVNTTLDGVPAVALATYQRPGSNALITAQEIREAMAQLSKDFPVGLEYRIVYDPTIAVSQSIANVTFTIFEASFLVVLVVLFFLQTWRATIIPLVAIPISLIGTFGAMAAFGLSINNLSLFGLVLAIGIVVDDAIVVVENIERHLATGLSPKEATRKAMDEVSTALISIALVLAAVFVPTVFLGGLSGQFYRQFALTVAVSTAISAFVSLTLTPALSAILLEPHGESRDWLSRLWDRIFGRFFDAFNRAFERTSHWYARVVERLTRRVGLGLIGYGLLLVLTVFAFTRVPVGFVPEQDQGYLLVNAQLPDGATLERTDRVIQQVSEIALGIPGIQNAIGFSGFSVTTQANDAKSGTVFLPFNSFKERVARGLPADGIRAELRARIARIPEANLVVITPPRVRGLGFLGGFTLYVQDRSGIGPQGLQAATQQLVNATKQNPKIAFTFSPFRASAPQIFADVNRARIKMMNIPLASVFETLQVYLGSVYVNDLSLLGRTYQVRAQADGRFRTSPEDIARLMTRNIQGEMVPLGSLVDLRHTTGPDVIPHYNIFPAASIVGAAGPGASSGDAIAEIETLAERVLPPGTSIEWTGLAYQQIREGNTAAFLIPLGVLFVFLTLAAQYESWSLPLAILLIVPMCLLFAITGIGIRGLENDILTQIGFLVLIGLASKNAVLIVEFARVAEQRGSSPVEAVVEACRLRLRPIIMTSLAFILGVVPLVVASGAGFELRRNLGTAVFSGMIGVTLFGLFLTPIFYVALRRHRRKFSRSAGGAVV